MSKPKKQLPKLQKRLIELKKTISEHNRLYHVLDQPTITDYEYDQFFSELLEIETKHPEWITKDSPSQRVGGEPLEAFEKAPHRQPMLSLQNSHSPADILAFDERIKRFLKEPSANIEYLCEPKLDGLAIELIYEKGALTGALTRGDGFVGEQVFSNVKTIPTIPLQLKMKEAPNLLEVRGEILIMKKDFLKLNKNQEKDGLNTFANARNAAAGTLRQLDPTIAATRPLRMFSHSLGEHTDKEFSTQKIFFNRVKKMGLPTLIDSKFKRQPLIKLCHKIQEVIEHYHFIESIRSDLEYEIDGLVIKVNKIELQKKLGSIARSPRWACAAKFKPEQSETIIKDIVVQVGRTGAITPVAIMEPVKVGGVTLTHATLHNQEEIQRKDVRKDDRVIVQRAGDVIPEVVSVAPSNKRTGSSKPFKFPKQCPTCQSDLKRNKDEAILRCENSLCPSIVKESLKHFASKRAMNIDRLGDKLIKQFVDHKLIAHFSDIYHLKREELLELERQGEKSVDNLLDSIQKSTQPPFERFIYALGIRFVGEQTARALSNHFKNINNLIQSSEEELLSINDIGPKVASAICQAFSKEEFTDEIQKLLEVGIQIQYSSSAPGSPKSQKFKNLTFVITGTLPMGREDLKNLIHSHGGKVSSSVSQKTNYVLAGEASGSKLEKAQKLGLKILDWKEFLEKEGLGVEVSEEEAQKLAMSKG